jgi:hypothetical protein
MKKYFEVLLGGVLAFWPMLAARAQEPIRIVVAEQNLSPVPPVETRVRELLRPTTPPNVYGAATSWLAPASTSSNRTFKTTRPFSRERPPARSGQTRTHS